MVNTFCSVFFTSVSRIQRISCGISHCKKGSLNLLIKVTTENEHLDIRGKGKNNANARVCASIGFSSR